MVVLRGDHDEPVVSVDDRSPLSGVLVLVLPHRWRQRFVEVRQRIVGQVDQLELRVVALSRDVQYPAGDVLSPTAWAGASEDDADPDHVPPPSTDDLNVQ